MVFGAAGAARTPKINDFRPSQTSTIHPQNPARLPSGTQYKSMRFGAMDVTKPYKFIGFGAMDVTKPYKSIGFGAKSCQTAFRYPAREPGSGIRKLC